MNTRLLRIPAALLYLIAISLITIYLVLCLNPLLQISPSERLVLLCSACFAIYCGSILITRTVSKTMVTKVMKATFLLFFILYILLITTLTQFDSYYGRHIRLFAWDSKSLNFYLRTSLNLIPFSTISGYVSAFFNGRLNTGIIITNIIGNLVAFTPFALFLPLLFKKFKSFLWFFVGMIIITISVELLQFAMLTGTCDIDDIILNVAGACLFFGLFHMKHPNKVIDKLTLLRY